MLAAGEVPAGFKDSGIDWLGDIPSHWEAGNIRRFAQMRTGHTPSRQVPEYWEDCSIPWFTLADVWQLRDGTRKYLGQTKEKISDLGLANSAAELLPPGTVILSRTASVGFSGIMPTAMATTQDFWNWVCGPKLIPDYLLWLFRAMGGKVSQITSGSTHKTIYQGDAASLEICVPPLETQRRIARFLDEKTARIDALIEKKRALLDRLAEKRKALITRAVTKGLSPQAPMRPSGIEWLGDIPAHWAVKRLRFLLTGGTLNGLYKPKEAFDPDGIPFVQMGEAFRSPVFDGGTEDRVIATEEEVKRWGLKDGDFLIARRSIVFEGSGKSVLVSGLDSAHLFESSMIRIRPKDPEIYSSYLSYYFQSHIGRESVLSVTKRVTISGIDSQQLKSIHIPVPPQSEAREISDSCRAFDQRSASVEKEIIVSIQQLAEYRSALITGAVTGKLADLR